MSSTSTSPSDGNGNNLYLGFKLNGKEMFTTWVFAMTTLLNAHGLGDYIDKTKVSTATDAKKKARTMLAITRNVEMPLLSLIKGYPNDPAGAWAALSAEYAGKSNQDMATLLIELFSLKLASGASLEQAKKHIENMVDLNLRLKEIDDTRALPDLHMGVLLCMSLPDEMEQVRYGRLSGPSDELTPSNIRDDVISLLRRMEVTDNSQVDTKLAMSTMQNVGGKPFRHNGGKSRSGFKGKCFYCDKTGHRAADCWHKAKKQSERNEAVTEDGSAHIAMTVLSTGNTPRKGPRDWIVDSATTCGHVTTHRKHLENYTEYDEGMRPTIGGVSGERIEVHGKGDVRLKMATGRTITLKDVKYAPQAAANLFGTRTALSRLGAGAEHREQHRSSKFLDKLGNVLMTSSLRQGLLYLDLATEQDFC
jgi:hypothetical protein